MNIQNFSNTFDTLLASYSLQTQFGEGASKVEITLDEYEKSVLLTQAQDIILKSYFDRSLNNQGQGFDDSTRRQVDFSSLIKVTELDPYGDNSNAFDPRGIIYKMPLKKVRKLNPDYDPDDDESQQYIYEDSNTTDVLFILNEKLIARTVVTPEIPARTAGLYYKCTSDTPNCKRVKDFHPAEGRTDLIYIGDVNYGGTDTLKVNDYVVLATESTDKVDPVYDNNGFGKEYVIVPINYKEYDREMSKPFAQPLKKQVWRLFQNNTQGFDIQSELIPRWNLAANETISAYKIRYIRRPCPIVLVDLPNELEIDGFTKAQECELNPILHPEILQKALEIAISTRGGAANVSRNNRESNQ
jgi:hypothetical protein